MAHITQPVPFIDKPEISAYDLGYIAIGLAYTEPKRLNMNDWGRVFTNEDIGGFAAWDSPLIPECGAVCCIGGWIGLLVKGEVTASSEAVRIMIGADWEAQSGRDSEGQNRIMELNRCFYTFPDGEFTDDPAYVPPQVGTQEYVKAATAPFVAWLEKNRDYLKARMVKIKRQGPALARDTVY